MGLFELPKKEAKSDYPTQHPVDGYGKQMLPGWGQEPCLEPYRTQKREVGNKREQLGQTERR